MARQDGRGPRDRRFGRARGRLRDRRTGRVAGGADQGPRDFCEHRHAKDADLRARTGADASGHAGRPQHIAKRGRERLPNDVHHPRDSGQLSFPNAYQQAAAGRDRLGRADEGVAVMFITKKHLDRRTFLRGAMGVSIALPLLDAMIPAATAQSLTAGRARQRFGVVYMPNGIYPDMWHPEETGSDFKFKTIMKPLERHRAYLTTISQLKAPDGGKDMGGIHMGASAAFLNGTGPLGRNGEFNRVE